ncbi:hypothetical protein [Rhodoligotrophos ferricapiens]
MQKKRGVRSRDETGTAAVFEYGLIAAGIALAIVTVIVSMAIG